MKKYWINIVLFVLAGVLFLASVLLPLKTGNQEYDVLLVEKAIEKRTQKLDKIIEIALERDDDYLFTANLPEDMVLYRYTSDHLSAWNGQLPLSYDEYLSRNHSSLYYVGPDYELYSYSGINYLVKMSQKDNVKLVAALLLSENGQLHLDSDYTIFRLNSSEGLPVSLNGRSLFKLASNSISIKSPMPAHLAWLGFLFLIVSFLIWLYHKPSLRHAFVVILICFAGSFVTYSFLSKVSSELYPVILLLVGNFFIFTTCLSLFFVRKRLWYSLKTKASRVLASVLDISFICFFIWLVYMEVFSVVLYTHITLQLHMLWSLNFATFVVYVSIIQLLVSLAILIELLQPALLKIFRRKFSIFNLGPSIVFSLVASIYVFSIISTVSFQRERLVASSWAENLSNTRDYALETHLTRVERQISRDEVVARALEGEQYAQEARSRLMDRYFSMFLNIYDVHVQVGGSRSKLGFDEGVRIENGSRFFFAPLAEQRCRYVAAYQFYANNGRIGSVYIILEPKYPNKNSLAGMLHARAQGDIPARYSYAMYSGGERKYFKGNFAYPTKLTDALDKQFASGHDIYFISSGYMHFISMVGEDEYIAISRPEVQAGIRIIGVVLVALVLFFCLMPLRRRRHKLFIFEKSHFKRTLTLLVIASLLITMAILVLVSVSFVYDRNNNTAQRMMADKVNSIRFQLQSSLRSSSSEELTSRETMELLRRVGDNSGSDISLYSPDGKVLLSTAPELHNQNILGYRLDATPYYHLTYLNEGHCIQPKKINHRSVYMLYAPILDSSGNVSAIFSSPYMEGGREYRFDAVMHSFSVIVVFIILLIVSIMLVSYFIDRTLKPLSNLAMKMRSGEVDKLVYNSKYSDDEVAYLVNSYNRMVDDLSESRNALAQAERDKAWSEMARNVAHEIKNPLTPMRLQIQRVQRLKANDDPSWPQKFDSMSNVLLEHIDILTETANQFSDFAKLYTEDPVDLDLDLLLREELSLYESHTNISFEYLGLQQAMVQAPRPQLIRVVVNLLNNAVQACEKVASPQIFVSLRNGSDPAFYEVVVEDNGPGVDAGNVNKLFTPKFTTKDAGSGLGLSICKSILQKCGATISYSRSYHLGGACFTILYPKLLRHIADN